MEIAVDLITDLAEKLRSDAKRLEEEKEKIRRNIESLLEMIKSGEMSSLSAGNLMKIVTIFACTTGLLALINGLAALQR